MIDEELRRLGEMALDRSLDHLKSDVWRRLAVRSRSRAAVRRRVSLQSVAIVVALAGSVAAGVSTARSIAATHRQAVIALGLELTPSGLLIGGGP